MGMKRPVVGDLATVPDPCREPGYSARSMAYR
jgi:hypothetical protein